MIFGSLLMRCCALVVIAAALFVAPAAHAQSGVFDVVITNGRVIDLESRLDAVRTIGIRGGRIAAIYVGALQGKRVIGAKGLVVAPGFIGLHAHGQDDENYRIFTQDGVTTALELEIGTGDVPALYAASQGKALINYGVSAGHIKARMTVMKDGGTLLPLDNAWHGVATAAQIAGIRQHLDNGQAAGALGVGMELQYTPAASKFEVLEGFRAAAKYRAPVFVHTRSLKETDPGSAVESYVEVIAASAVTGAPLHFVRLNSTSLASTPKTLTKEAVDRGSMSPSRRIPTAPGDARVVRQEKAVSVDVVERGC